MLHIVDKEKLSLAFAHLPAGEAEDNIKSQKGFYRQCLNDTPPFNGLCLNELGSFYIPVMHQVVKDIIGTIARDKSSPAILEILSTDDVHKSLDEIAILAFKKILGVNLDDKTEVEIVKDQLTLCTQDGAHHKKLLPNFKRSGIIFGKLILQVPVIGGYKGGRLKVENGVESYFFDSNQHSNQYFYCTAFFSSYKHEWEPVKNGCMMALEYDLLWHQTPGLTNSSLILRDYLAAVNLSKEALNAWKISSTAEVEMDEDSKRLPSFASRLSPRDHLLIIPLGGAYYETSFSFSSLQGEDRKMVHVLQSIDYIDVHLAIVRQSQTDNSQQLVKSEVKSECAPLNRTFQIVQWIYSNIALPQFQLNHLNFPSQLVGEIKTVLKPQDATTNVQQHQVLVIQPLRQSIHRCCQHQFDAMLDYMESRLLNDGASQILRLHSLQCLAHVLNYCIKWPLLVWDIPDTEKAAKRTCRLLNICKNLEAQKEGIFLIELLGKDIPKSLNDDENTQVFYEGVRSEAVARSIIKMICNLGGWSVFSVPVLGLLTAARIPRQLESFTAMVVALIENDLVPNARDVAYHIFHELSTNWEMAKKFSQVFLDAIVALENSLKTTDGSLLKRFLVPLFPRLSSYQQHLLLIDLQKNSSVLKSTFLTTYKNMCHFPLRNGLCSSDGVLTIVDEIVASYVLLNDKKIMKVFLDRVLWRKDKTGKDFNSSAWLEAIITWTSSSTFVTDTLMDSFQERIEFVTISASKPPDRDEDIRRADCARFFFVFLQLDQSSPQLEDPQLLDSFTTIFQKMTPNRLIKLVTDLLEQENDNVKPLKQDPRRKLLLMKVGCSLLERDSSVFQGEPLIATVIELLECFIGSQDKLELAHKFVANICCIDNWSPFNKIELISRILLSPGIWATGKEGATNIYHQCMTSLLRKWIAGLDIIMDLPCSPETVEEKANYLRKNFSDFFLNYTQQHKTEDSSIGNDLSPSLLDKLAVKELGQLMWDVHQADMKQLPSLKKFSASLELYKDLCLRFVQKNNFMDCIKLNSNLLIETTCCLLWLGDQQLFLLLSKKIGIHRLNKPNAIITRIAESMEIRQLIETFPYCRDPFCRMLEQRAWIIAKELERQTAHAWTMTKINLPAHPNVQHFLRSSAQKMTYANFKMKKEAREFANLLSTMTDNGYTLQVNVSGEEFETTCQIRKLEIDDRRFKLSLLLEEEKMVLESVLTSLNYVDTSGDSVSSGSDGDVGIVAAKKIKLDFSLFDISD